jgi:general secretion pathway protein F
LPPLMRALAGVVERGQPLPTALAALAKSYPSVGVRRKLRRVNESIQQGSGDWRPFADQGLITQADAAVLDAAARLGNLPWAMRALADGQERRRGYRLQVGLQILWPVTIVLIALVVGFIVVSAFLPLVGLIEKLA